MNNLAYVTRITEVRPHPNANRLLLGECFDSTVVVDTSYKEGEVGIYFGEGLKLDYKFCDALGLLRKTDEQGKNTGGFIDPKRLNIRSCKIRGEVSDGLFLRMEEVLKGAKEANIELGELKEGDTVGLPLVDKYVPKSTSRQQQEKGKRKKKRVCDTFPWFREHEETEGVGA